MSAPRARAALAELHRRLEDEDAAYAEALAALAPTLTGPALERALASYRLRKRTGLNAYERELVTAPSWQFRELQEAMR